jgi:hypothetical protein
LKVPLVICNFVNKTVSLFRSGNARKSKISKYSTSKRDTSKLSYTPTSSPSLISSSSTSDKEISIRTLESSIFNEYHINFNDRYEKLVLTEYNDFVIVDTPIYDTTSNTCHLINLFPKAEPFEESFTSLPTTLKDHLFSSDSSFIDINNYIVQSVIEPEPSFSKMETIVDLTSIGK